MSTRRKSDQSLRILLVAAESELRDRIQVAFATDGAQTVSVSDGGAATRELDGRSFDYLVCCQPEETLIEDVTAVRGGPRVIAVVAPDQEPMGLMRQGAHDVVSVRSRPEEILLAVKKAEERTRPRLIGARVPGEPPQTTLIGRSAAMRKVHDTIGKLAEYKTNVLITGESGTGKELVARAIHDLGPRRRAPFVAVNCGAIPENLLESELFGHKKGAFTDASRDKKGLFELAHTGTLFLDEIGEMPLGLQVKLLRAIQEEEIRPLGDDRTVQVDARVLAATTRDLALEVAEGRFREDLFYRLNVMAVRLPALRERTEDIPALVEYFIARKQEKHARSGMTADGVTPEAMQVLMGHQWPGNVRELENTVERAMVLCDGGPITVAELPDRVRGHAAGEGAAHRVELSIKKTMRATEERLIRQALHKTGGNRTNAAKILEISHRALLYKIKEYGISA